MKIFIESDEDIVTDRVRAGEEIVVGGVEVGVERIRLHQVTNTALHEECSTLAATRLSNTISWRILE